MKKIMTLILVFVISMVSFAKKIAVIGTMDSEIKSLLVNMKNVKETKHANINFYQGELNGNSIVLFKSNVGSVNSAMATTIAMENFDIGYVIFTGVVGPMNSKLNVTVDSLSDSTLVKIANDAAHTVFTTMGETSKIYTGILTKGHNYIAEKEIIDALETNYSSWPTNIDGEAVSIVAKSYNVPVVILRAMVEESDSPMSFAKFEEVTGKNTTKVVTEILKSL